MEDKLKLAEIKGYLESCLNKFEKVPTNAPYDCFYKDLNTLLDIVMDKQADQEKPQVVTFPTDGSAMKHIEYINKLIQESKSLKLEISLLNQEKKLYEKQRNEFYYKHTGREWE